MKTYNILEISQSYGKFSENLGQTTQAVRKITRQHLILLEAHICIYNITKILKCISFAYLAIVLQLKLKWKELVKGKMWDFFKSTFLGLTLSAALLMLFHVFVKPLPLASGTLEICAGLDMPKWCFSHSCRNWRIMNICSNNFYFANIGSARHVPDHKCLWGICSFNIYHNYQNYKLYQYVQSF